MSKQLFELMREQEIATSNFLPKKKEIIEHATKFSKQLIESGEHNLYEKFAEVTRLKQALETIENEIKAVLPQENFESFGLKGTFRSGGSTPNYSEDETYAQIQKQLKDREALLKTALSQDMPIYDNEGVEVPKVSLNHRKSSLTITY
jgi:hypothetical protein